jgi:hypothetical protein
MTDINKLGSALRAVYPDFQTEDIIVPKLVVDAMIIIQSQHTQFTTEYIRYVGISDKCKYDVDKTSRQMEDLVADATVKLLTENSIPDQFKKNKELTDYYIRYGSRFSTMYLTLKKQYEEDMAKSARAKSNARKCELLVNSVKTALDAATQILSYLKHEERLHGN